MTDRPRPASQRPVRIPADQVSLEGEVTLPSEPAGLVVFAHGSGSSRLSPRNRQVARQLEAAGLGTLLFDLLTEEEAAGRANVFDIPLLASRLVAVIRWVRDHPDLMALPLGLFGASTGAGAALVAAARVPEAVQAVVSRGGRPDLAGDWLSRVRAPTLLMVGGADAGVLELNRSALASLTCPKRLVVVPGATHLFEERGALETVAREAAGWFVGWFRSRDRSADPNGRS